jgi:hypothetical protein
MATEPHLWVLARKLQATAQTGLEFNTNHYDRERYELIAKIAAELMASHCDTPVATFQKLFGEQSGYATPKVDVRAAAFRDGNILLVREAADGLWTMPGGWADVNDSPREAVEREVWEESGFRSKAKKLAAVYDRAKHPHVPPLPFAKSSAGKQRRARKRWRWVFLRRTHCRHCPSRATWSSRFTGVSST